MSKYYPRVTYILVYQDMLRLQFFYTTIYPKDFDKTTKYIHKEQD